MTRPRHAALPCSPSATDGTAARGRRTGLRPAGTKGSVLIVALMISALIAVALGSYINLNLGSARLARRSFHQQAAFNLAEAGAEEALWSFNQAALASPAAWTDWTDDGSSAWRKFDGFSFGAAATGSVKVYIDNKAPAAGVRPRIIAQALVEAPGESGVTKMLEITLARRSLFANGLMARNSIRFSGTRTSVDSWNSDPDSNAATAAIPYSVPVRNDRGTVASMSVLNTAVLVQQATVWGYVSTGGEQPAVGTQGLIGPFGTPAGTIHPGRVATDFNADLPSVALPAGGTVLASVGATLGTLGTTTSWRIPGIALRGRDTLTILGDVTIILTGGPGTRALDVTGNASIIIAPNSSLKVYAEGDILIAGNGLANPNHQPVSAQFWGVGEPVMPQTIHLAGNGALKAVVYAPYADVQINGNGDVMGSVVGNTITLNGNADFHYDESLANLTDNQPYGVVRWRSLATRDEQAPYRDALGRF
ncbi:MAG TPA: hypothetical protein VGD88_12350 [Opitutaceae bacterium]